ncbi:MAG: hypothetical protein HY939_06665 [Gammaproteobacteria bacterium]|nr:hypothetical protein [Gammaproteobacteria bacterium]
MKPAQKTLAALMQILNVLEKSLQNTYCIIDKVMQQGRGEIYAFASAQALLAHALLKRRINEDSLLHEAKATIWMKGGELLHARFFKAAYSSEILDEAAEIGHEFSRLRERLHNQLSGFSMERMQQYDKNSNDFFAMTRSEQRTKLSDETILKLLYHPDFAECNRSPLGILVYQLTLPLDQNNGERYCLAIAAYSALASTMATLRMASHKMHESHDDDSAELLYKTLNAILRGDLENVLAPFSITATSLYAAVAEDHQLLAGNNSAPPPSLRAVRSNPL